MKRAFAAVVLLLLALARVQANDLDDLLKELDARAQQLEDNLRQDGKKTARVAALVSRRFAGDLDGDRAYQVATYSFEHATRDDEKRVVRNDWDIEFGNGGDLIDVRMVTDDASDIRHLGEVDFENPFAQEFEVGVAEPHERVDVQVNHVYVVHTLDSETNLWAKIQILELDPGKSVIFRWEIITDTTEVAKLDRAPGKDMATGRVRIQMRAGALGGNPFRAWMNGKVDACADELVDQPLDMTAEPDIDEDARAFVQGGFIPQGQVWILRSVEYAGVNRGDSNGDGPFVVAAGGKELARREEESGEFKDVWKGRLVLRPGQEDTVYVEISNSSCAEVVFHGILCDEKWADATEFPALTKEERLKVDGLVAQLDSEDAGNRDGATRDLIRMGPPIVETLKGLLAGKRSPEAQARLKEILLQLQGEY